MNAVKGHDQKVGFKEDAIRLDIPFPSLEGITTVNGGWRIMASGPPVVSIAVANKYADHITDSHDDIAMYSPEFFSRECVGFLEITGNCLLKGIKVSKVYWGEYHTALLKPTK